MALTDEDVREILRIVDETPLRELRIETEGFSLHVRGDGAGEEPPVEGAPEPAPAAAAAPGDGAAVEVVPSAADERLLTISAPMLGTFYRAEGPGKAPFVDVGSRVEAESIVGIVEVMKMMNSVAAGVAGTIVEVCAQDAGLVEYGEALFRLDAS
jgi:acetyl-CoA carboxylase biotin carboxyl carrier protein